MRKSCTITNIDSKISNELKPENELTIKPKLVVPCKKETAISLMRARYKKEEAEKKVIPGGGISSG